MLKRQIISVKTKNVANTVRNNFDFNIAILISPIIEFRKMKLSLCNHSWCLKNFHWRCFIFLCLALTNQIDPTKKAIPNRFKVNLVRKVEPSTSVLNNTDPINTPISPIR